MDHETLLAEAGALLPWMVELRRRLHRRPEVGLELPWTRSVVARELRAMAHELPAGREHGARVEGDGLRVRVVARGEREGV